MRSFARLPLIILALALPVSACAGAAEAIKGPKLTPVGDPTPLVTEQPSLLSAYRAHDDTPRPASANSIWRAGARTFFNDQRAAKVGDILTVLITIDDSAQISTATTRKRTSGNDASIGTSLGSLFGTKVPGVDVSPSGGISTAGTMSDGGTGSVNRNEKLTTNVAVVVTQTLPNGNLVIEGHQEVRVNFEIRDLVVQGIVRPEDIQSDNTILSEKIAEARISYGGRGQITDVQQPRYGQQVMDVILPF